MGRGGRGGGSRSSSSSPSRSSFTASRPQPQPTQAPMQQPQTAQRSGIFGGIGSTIMQGMAFGAGSEVGHQAVRSVIGGGSHSNQHVEQQHQPQQQQVNNQSNVCQTEIQNFSECIQRNTDLSYCQTFADMLKTCKQSNGLLWK